MKRDETARVRTKSHPDERPPSYLRAFTSTKYCAQTRSCSPWDHGVLPLSSSVKHSLHASVGLRRVEHTRTALHCSPTPRSRSEVSNTASCAPNEQSRKVSSVQCRWHPAPILNLLYHSARGYRFRIFMSFARHAPPLGSRCSKTFLPTPGVHPLLRPRSLYCRVERDSKLKA